jgi:DNA-binding response OmpR family regulator/tetratricopeptide (TPR) repeat protein
MNNRILVVDGDPRSLRVLDVSLRSAGFQVETASSGTEAWESIQAVPPGLIIADVEVSGINGFDLCTRVRQAPGAAAIPFILIAADQSLDKKIRSLEVGADDYLAKPAYIKEIVARVRGRLQRRDRERVASPRSTSHERPQSQPPDERFTGDLGDITVVDLVQLVEGNARSGIAHLRNESGMTGTLYFRNGAVVDAEAGRLAGYDALLRLFAWTRGTFDLEWKKVRRNDVVGRSTADLLIEGMHHLDEWNHMLGALAPISTVFEVDYRMLAERLAEIPDEVNGVLKLCDGVRTLGQLTDECTLSDLEVLNALVLLRDEAIIYDASNSGPRRGVVLDTSPGAGRAAPGPTEPLLAGAAAPRGRGSESPDRVRRRTTPGFGQSALGIAAIDETAQDQRERYRTEARTGSPSLQEDNVIRFSTEAGGALALSRGRSPATDRDIASPEAAGQVAVRVSGAMSRTHRGFGPAAPVAGVPNQQATTEAPQSTSHDSAIVREAIDVRGVGSTGSSASKTEARPAPRDHHSGQVHPARPERAVSESSSRRALAAPRVEDVADATVRISYPDDDIDGAEALAELGLAPRWRGLRFMAVALVLAALGYTVFRFFRVPPARAPQIETASPIPRSPSPPRSPALALAPSAAPSEPPGSSVPGPGGVVKQRTGGEAEARPVPAASGAPPAAGGGTEISTSEDTPPPPPPPPPPPTPTPAPNVAAAPSPSGVKPPPATISDFARNLAQCRSAFVRDRLQEALTACAGAVEANPRSAEALTMLAHAELNRDRLPRAGELAARAIAIDPNMADAYVIIGGVAQDSGLNVEAKDAYTRYLQLAPNGRYADELRSIVNSL